MMPARWLDDDGVVHNDLDPRIGSKLYSKAYITSTMCGVGVVGQDPGDLTDVVLRGRVTMTSATTCLACLAKGERST